MRLHILVVLASALCCNVAVAGLTEGLDALRKNDFATAVKELRPLAERGDAEAQYRVGLMYEFGKGYPQDKAQGIAWFRKAAAQNHAGALERMGAFAQSGRGGASDKDAAKAYYERAAALGDQDAKKALEKLRCPYAIKDKRGNLVTNLCF